MKLLPFTIIFKLEKPGKFNIAVCWVQPAILKVLRKFLRKLKVCLTSTKVKQHPMVYSIWHRFAVWDAAALPPVIKINDTIYSKVQKSQVMEILSKYKPEEQ